MVDHHRRSDVTDGSSTVGVMSRLAAADECSSSSLAMRRRNQSTSDDAKRRQRGQVSGDGAGRGPIIRYHAADNMHCAFC